MTTKTAGKAAGQPRPTMEPPVETVQAAQEIHTLVHLIYGELAATRPWLTPMLPVSGVMQTMPGRPSFTASWQQPVPWAW